MAKYEQWLEPDGLLMIEGWAREGYTDEQLAEAMGIHPATLYVWLKKYSEIADALKRGKAPVDRMVENALLKRALGYEYTEVTKERILDRKTGQYKLTVTKETVKKVPPDVVAQIFWLKNRRPDLWREKRQELGDIYSQAEALDAIQIGEIKESTDNLDSATETA